MFSILVNFNPSFGYLITQLDIGSNDTVLGFDTLVCFVVFNDLDLFEYSSLLLLLLIVLIECCGHLTVAKWRFENCCFFCQNQTLRFVIVRLRVI